jgi:hypothetical protein
MKKLMTLAIVALFTISFAAIVMAAPPTIKITGGGIVQNNDSGLGDLISVGGFVAMAKGSSVLGLNGGDVWSNVKGQIQSKLVDATDPTRNVSSLHGEVVCIAALLNGSYEVRFVITRSSGENPVPPGMYGSLFVKDSGLPSEGGTDLADEDFSNLGESQCDTVGGEAHEPLLAGNFTVH